MTVLFQNDHQHYTRFVVEILNRFILIRIRQFPSLYVNYCVFYRANIEPRQLFCFGFSRKSSDNDFYH